MKRLPPWIQGATRPTTDEVDRVVGSFDPELARFARDATAPSAAEIAVLRHRAPRRRLTPSVMSFAVVLAGATAIGLMWMEPQGVEVRERASEPGIYRITSADELTPILGVWVRGEGSVEVAEDGRLVLEGDLLLTVTAPVVFAVGAETFSASDAIVWIDETGLRVASGRVEGATGTLSAGDRRALSESTVAVVRPVELSEPSPTSVAAPVRAPAPRIASPPETDVRPAPQVDVRPVPAPAPAPAPQVTVAPPPAPVVDPTLAAALAWRDVLVRLEQGGPVEDRLAVLRTYRAKHPGSPFDPEAEALSLLIRGTDGEPSERLRAVERWLDRNPSAARSIELHALAARIARERLEDCSKAAPHDRVVAGTTGAPREKARAFLGLCEMASGRSAEGQALLDGVNPDLLDPALRRAVAAARTGGTP